jgi:alpha-tubulin suppressor-like RCC1 family protein
VVGKMMKLKITCFIVLFLMVSVNLANTDTLSFTAPLEDEEISKEVIVSLSSANIPGFQEGSIFTDTTLSSGLSHTCALLDNGAVSCWGSGEVGRLGNGVNAGKNTPTLTSSLDANRTATAISSGGSHTCAILDDASVSCWGSGSDGQLGDGTTTDRNTPTQTSSLGTGRTAVAISSGAFHTCAILDDASVSCWGWNSEGQLGDGTTTDRNTPTQTSSLGTGRTAVAISSGYAHTCAILDNGAVSCWGDGGNGRLGNGGTSSKTTPILTSSLGTGRTAVALSSGYAHTCAILDNGAVSCWGLGSNGRLGNGGTHYKSTPTLTSSLGTERTAVAISSGYAHTCAVLDDASVSCWGQNGYGQLGDGTTTHRNTPTQTSSLGTGRTAVAISSGAFHTCAILDDGSVSCWGYNSFGQLGDGTTTQRNTPTPTSSLGSFRTAAVSERDLDNDGILNIFDLTPAGIDSDGDGVGDTSDAFPNDPNETTDSDGDGVGNNADAFPNDASESKDFDGDGVGDNSDAFPYDWKETVDSDGDGVGDNSDAYPNDPAKSENETTSNESENDNNSTNNTEPTNSTNVIEYIDYECATQDFDCDGILDDKDDDADADGIMNFVDSSELVIDVKWVHKFTVVKTSDGFELQIEYRVNLYSAYLSQVSWVAYNDENGNERILMWDVSMDGSSYKTGVSSAHMNELKENLCQNPEGEPQFENNFDMFEWLNNSVLIEGVHVVPSEIECSWKNQPKEVVMEKLLAEIQSEEFLFNMHKEYEVMKYTIKYEVSENSQNLTILPIWAVNETSDGASIAFYVNDQVNGTTSVWFWWSQSYSSAFDLQNAEIGAMNSSISGLMSNIAFVVAALLGILIIRRRRRKKKLKRAMKKIAKEHIKDEKAAKKQAKMEKKKIKAESKSMATDLTDTNSANIEYDIDENTKPIIALPPQQTQESEIAKPIEPPENSSKVEEHEVEKEMAEGPVPKSGPRPSTKVQGVIGDDGYEWITFPPNSQNNFYRTPGDETWLSWDN